MFDRSSDEASVCVCACVRVGVCVCECVWERERERGLELAFTSCWRHWSNSVIDQWTDRHHTDRRVGHMTQFSAVFHQKQLKNIILIFWRFKLQKKKKRLPVNRQNKSPLFFTFWPFQRWQGNRMSQHKDNNDDPSQSAAVNTVFRNHLQEVSDSTGRIFTVIYYKSSSVRKKKQIISFHLIHLQVTDLKRATSCFISVNWRRTGDLSDAH